AGACEADGSCAAVNPAKIHQSACNLVRACPDVRLDVGMRPEMRLVKPPQGLDRNVKRATAQRAEALAFLDEFAQLGRWLAQSARLIEARDFAAGAIEAEDPLEARDLTAHPEDRRPRECGVGVP